MHIDNETKIVCSLGARQSRLGAMMHNAAYRHLMVNYIYVPFTVADLEGSIRGMRALGFRGSSVTMPFKEDAIRYIDRIDPIAADIGAVNTISNENSVLAGYNSDWIGAVEALREVSKLRGRKAVLLGAGGAARAIAYGLKMNGAEVVILNRNTKRARELSGSLNVEFGGCIRDLKKIKDYDILINATSVGFYPDVKNSIIGAEQMKEGRVVMDVVFRPEETMFLRCARSRKCITVAGYKMLLHQAVFQVELFTGKKAPFRVMEKALLSGLRSM
jgi:shikimate dehydrogenase